MEVRFFPCECENTLVFGLDRRFLCMPGVAFPLRHEAGRPASPYCALLLGGSLLVVGVPEVKNEPGMEFRGLLVPRSKFNTMPFMEWWS